MIKHPIVRQLLPHAASIVIFLLVAAIYFYPQLQGMELQAGDIVSFKGMSHELKEHQEKTGEVSLWTNAMFGGMPAYQISVPYKKNLMRYVEQVTHLFMLRPIGYAICLMIGFYLMLILFGVNQWLSLIGAVTFGLTSNTLILMEAGHMTKVRSIAFWGILLVGVVRAYQGKFLSGGVLFSLGLALGLLANHVQMTYYFFLVMGIFVVMKLVEAIQTKQLPTFAKASGVLLVGLVLALGTSTSNLWSTYVYSKDTMRGDPILKLEGDAKPSSSSEVSGLDWDYAMMWSNGWLDCAASLIPGVAGGGTGEYVGESSAFYKGLQRLGARLDGRVQAPLYWGSLPFTSGPSYFGAAIIFLFMASLIWVKGPIKWWLLSGVVLTFVLSMGKNIAFINHPLFDYLPLLNKFRTPNSVLTVTSFLVPLLAFLGLSKVLSGELSKDEIMRGVLIGGGVSGGLCLFFALLGPSMFDPATARDMGSVSRILGGQADQAMLQEFVKNVHADRLSLMRTDAFRSFLLIALTAGLVWALANKKIKEMVFLIGLGAIVLFDCWSVGKRYLNEESFVSTRQYEDNFQPRPVDSEILKDTDPNYRVLDLSVSTYQSARTSYFHKTIGGYHPAKLQRYEDIVQRHLIKGNPKVVNMLNTKYVITPQSQAQRNSEALGNAWFVSNIKMVQDANAEIDALDNIDPGEEAAIHQDFNDYIAGFQPQKGGTIQLTSYEPDHLTYASNASSEQLAVFSEVWYGPDKGWQAYINQQPVDHIRANYVLRAMKVPAGQHVIEFKFEPSSFYIGENISLIASLLIILGLIAFIYKEFSEFKPEEVVETAPKVVKKTKSPTVSKVKKTGSSKKKKKK